MALGCLAAGAIPAVAAAPASATGSGSIAGTITTGSSTPVPYGRVCVESATQDVCTNAEASGEYKIAGLVAGEYLVFFTGEVCPSVNQCTKPYVPEYYEHAATEAKAKKVTMPMPETAVTGIDEQLREGGKIQGEVRAKEGTEIVGAEVCGEVESTESRSGWTYAGCTHTAAHGDYTLEGLAEGDYRIEFTGEVCTPNCKQEYTQQWYENTPVLSDAKRVRVTGSATTSGVDAEMEDSGEISGRVVTSGAAPVEDTEACAERVGAQIGRCAVTNANGEYTIPGLEAGTYKVEFNGTTCQKGGCDEYLAQYYHDRATEEEAEPVEVTALHATTGIDAVLIEARKITGHVYAEGGGPIAETEVCAQRQAEGTERTEEDEHCAYSSRAGEYKIEGLPVGLYVVTFPGELCPSTECHPEYAPQFFEGATERGQATEVELTEATEKGAVNAHLHAGGSISGKITTDWLTPKPIKDAEVCASKTPPNGLKDACGYANMEGEYMIAGLQSGDYHVWFTGTVCPSVGPCDFGVYVEQFYDREPEGSDEEHAAAVSVSTSQTTREIDGELAEANPKLPTNTQPPQLTGTASVGAVLQCTEGQWSNNPSRLEYAWLRNGTVIAGANSSTYTVQSADQGTAIECRVTVSNGAGPASVTTSAIAIPAAVVPTTTTATTTTSVGLGVAVMPTTTTATTTTSAGLGVAVVTGPATVKAGKATIRLRCTGSSPCKGTVQLQVTSTAATNSKNHGKKTANVVIATASFSIAAGAFQSVSLALTGTGKKLLAKASKKGLQVTVSGTGVKAGSLVLKETPATGRHKN